MLKELLNKHNFRFSKKYGQNFISDTNLLRAIIADSGITQDSSVLEIGAGAGTLTRLLSEAAKSVVSFEIDRSLKPVLEESLAGADNIKLVFEDFLKLGDQELAELFPQGAEAEAVANLPYYITTPILFRLLESGLNLKSITVMLQKEVAERLTAHAGTKEYGVITAVINYRHEVRVTRTVSRALFFPAPEVDSAVVKIAAANKPRAKSDATYYRLVHAAFAMRRKTLANNLIAAFPLSRAQAEEMLVRAGFPADVRGERLSVADFIRLADIIEG